MPHPVAYVVTWRTLEGFGRVLTFARRREARAWVAQLRAAGINCHLQACMPAAGR
jgi:cell division septation protein DedD